MPIAWRPGTEFLAQDTLRLQPLIQGCVARPRNSRKNDRHFPGRIRTSLIVPSDAPGPGRRWPRCTDGPAGSPMTSACHWTPAVTTLARTMPGIDRTDLPDT